jgi:SpoVK/Ycf46/Vps4 family AAA+-type ATPase
LVIGPSGSGKTHVVRAVAESENLPIFEQSAGSWMPQGAKAEISSARRIAQFVTANDAGIIYLDEIEKPFPPDLSKTVPWERYCTDEFMSLLDAKVAQWESWSVPLAQKLDQSFFIVLSGAWQSAYLAAYKAHRILGGDWTNLSIADSFMDDNHLPPELLNRVSTNVIEVLPPSIDELAEMIERVQYDLGVMVDKSEAHRIAKEISQERKGVRAVEEFLLKRWMRHQEEAGGIR